MVRAPTALAWSFANTVVSRLGTLAVGIVLARLLGPEEFGTFAVALVALTAVLSFNELGVSLAIVRWAGDPRRIAPTVMTISVLTSVVLFGIVFGLAPAFSTAMGDPGATPIVRVLGVAIVVSGIVATPAMLMQREFLQRRKMLIDQVSVWLGTGVSLAMALAGAGAWSLAVGRLAGGIVSVVMFLLLSPVPCRFGLDRSSLRPLLQFGLPLAGASAIVFALNYADQLVVGGMLGSTALGFYVLAANLSGWPVNVFSQPLRSVAPPVFARLKHTPAQMRETFCSLLGVLARVALPVCLVLAGAAGPIVTFVYGEEWGMAASALTWLAVFGAFKIIFELVYDFLVIAGASGVILRIQTLSLIVIVPVVLAGAVVDGIRGVAAAQAVTAALILFPLYLYQLSRVGVPVVAAVRRLAAPAVVSVTTGFAAWGLGVVVESDALASMIAGAGVALAVAGLLLADRASLRHLRMSAAPADSEE
ncbi:oligosaccharide flippase family protein [Georgenia yuyongxinii]|uniref:Oligosaccharide flippase family protein n=1 Tax=Georgenia yuyongxinii TaxID=2589797 RepID=A0A552WLD2_9MICO|nr:oligosaccharide flippase family protein [Georgenia yuyongxinii]